MYMHICICIYIYIYRERERERDFLEVQKITIFAGFASLDGTAAW